ncbi:unnamed protein product [Gongylonema pulchrum]|uniref:Uncharacterized protein n=1 Tax=Gongylonema pulchrum TaxID=637853 RepID=A0A183E1I0_9BILA|nr:unnamed protein product [Gongylonema pulchrum]
MVELCELKLIDGGNLLDSSHWPADMDQHIAQLDFQRSSDEEEDASLFASVALGPSAVISTDSLDMEKLHARCEASFGGCLVLMFSRGRKN